MNQWRFLFFFFIIFVFILLYAGCHLFTYQDVLPEEKMTEASSSQVNSDTGNSIVYDNSNDKIDVFINVKAVDWVLKKYSGDNSSDQQTRFSAKAPYDYYIENVKEGTEIVFHVTFHDQLRTTETFFDYVMTGIYGDCEHAGYNTYLMQKDGIVNYQGDLDGINYNSSEIYYSPDPQDNYLGFRCHLNLYSSSSGQSCTSMTYSLTVLDSLPLELFTPFTLHLNGLEWESRWLEGDLSYDESPIVFIEE